MIRDLCYLVEKKIFFVISDRSQCRGAVQLQAAPHVWRRARLVRASASRCLPSRPTPTLNLRGSRCHCTRTQPRVRIARVSRGALRDTAPGWAACPA
jgi:hypothetical protein